ncbi:MAG: hypothetical protein ACKV2T_31015 [Kofleriaceae bacterium]
MQRLALACAIGSLVAAALPSPGLFVALGLGIAAIGAGWVGFSRRESAGAVRLGAAAAITLGGLGFALGAVRVVLVLLAISHVDGML